MLFFKNTKYLNCQLELSKAQEKINTLTINLENSNIMLNSLKDIMPKHSTDKYIDINIKIRERQSLLNVLNNKTTKLTQEIKSKVSKLSMVSLQLEMEEYSLYIPDYEFANSGIYKDKLSNLRKKQTALIKDSKAINFDTNWNINGSKSEGKKFINNNIKQMLKLFNLECDKAISSVKYNNYNRLESRIIKSFDDINILNKTNRTSITNEYKDCKLRELKLGLDYKLLKQEEKENKAELRSIELEDKRVAKELDEERVSITKRNKAITKEYKQLESELNKANKQLAKDISLGIIITEQNKAINDLKDKLLLLSIDKEDTLE